MNPFAINQSLCLMPCVRNAFNESRYFLCKAVAALFGRSTRRNQMNARRRQQTTIHVHKLVLLAQLGGREGAAGPTDRLWVGGEGGDTTAGKIDGLGVLEERGVCLAPSREHRLFDDLRLYGSGPERNRSHSVRRQIVGDVGC